MQTLLPVLASSTLLIAFFLAQFAGVLFVPFGLPGPLLQGLAALALSLATHGARMRWYWAAGFVALGIAAELIDLAAGRFGLKKFGASKHAAWGALLGGVLGACGGSLIPVPLLGSVIASFIGTFAGAILFEMRHERTLEPNVKIGIGAVLGRALGVALKLCIAFFILLASAAVVMLS